MKSIFVIGAGGFGKEIITYLEDINKSNNKWEIMGFIDDMPSLKGEYVLGYQVLGDLNWLISNSNSREDIFYVIAIGNPETKKIIVNKLSKSTIKPATLIHPSSIISRSVSIGIGAVICPGCILTSTIKICDFVTININCTVGHDSVIESYVSVMPGVSISGAVNVLEGTYIGTGATIINNIQIGKNAIVGAGAVVISNVSDNTLVVGVPAKKVKEINKSINNDN